MSTPSTANELPRSSRALRVLVVDDSAFMRNALARMISSDPAVDWVETASSGSEALDKIPLLDPDVVTLDVEMPGLNGLETLRSIMSRFPRPVIMVSSATLDDAETTFEALAAGAFDCIAKQLHSDSLDITHIRESLIAKIKAAADSRISQTVNARRPPRPTFSEEPTAVPTAASVAIVAIGASTGGPKALQEILPQLPADLSIPIVVVQHMPAGFTNAFAQRLNTLCEVKVKEAFDREPLNSGVVYIAPAGIHLRVERTHGSLGHIRLAFEPANHPHMPSIDIMMESVAAQFRGAAMGVIMTGMGSDGAKGMKAIHRAGGITIGQDEGSCTVPSMPRACARLGILQRVRLLQQIPQEILQATLYRKHA